MEQLTPVAKAALLLGGITALAHKLGVSPPTVHEWKVFKRPVPPKRCMAIERLTAGAVTRRDLRPDDWQQIWPEMPVNPDDIQQNQAPALTPHAQVAINTVADTGDADQPWDGVERRQMTEGV